MSVTTELIERLRHRLDKPKLVMAPDAPIQVRPPERPSEEFARASAAHTTAMLGIGHVGTRYQTSIVLQFQAELAVAHEAVADVLPDEWPQQNGLLSLKSRVTEHRQYLLRPDLGRRLDEASLGLLRERAVKNVDVQPILADGLSAVACRGSGLTLLKAFTRECENRGWKVGTPMCARFARVWLEDEIGQEVQAKVAVILLGERPGLGTGDGLSAYMVYEPRLGKTDGNRNMMSNIHARGTPPEAAATRLAQLAGAMLEQKTSGVTLNLAGLGGAGGTTYREPQKRVQLVEVPR